MTDQPTLIDTGKRLTPEQAKRIKDATAGPTMTLNLQKQQTIIDSRPPHYWVRQAAIEHGLPEDRKYGASLETGQLFFVDYD